MTNKLIYPRILGLAIVCTLSFFSVSCDSPPATPEPAAKPEAKAPAPESKEPAKIPAATQSPGVLKTH
jgi:hypothetical protein